MYRKSLVLLVGLAVVGFAVQSQAALVSYFALEEGSGTTAVNSGTGGPTYNGTLSKVAAYGLSDWPLPAWTSGKFSGGLKFTATADPPPNKGPAPQNVGLNLVSVPNEGGISGTSATYSMWVRWDDVQPVFTTGDSNANGLYGVLIGSLKSGRSNWALGVNAQNTATPGLKTSDPAAMKGLRVYPYRSGGWTNGYVNNTASDAANTFGTPQGGTGFTPPGTGSWHHVVLTFASPNWSVYMNGVLLRTVSQSATLPTGTWPLMFGGLWTLGEGDFMACGSNTTMDDVGLFNETLSVGKVKAIYNTTLVAGLENYDLGKMNTLFGVYDTGTPATIGSLDWEKVTGLSNSPGDAWFAGGYYYVQFGANDGVRAIPEPSTLALLAGGLLGLAVYVWRKRK